MRPHRTTVWSATLALGLGGLLLGVGATSAPASAVTSCDGRAVDVVGVPGQPLLGTEYDDVVDLNGASSLSTLGGNDVVCVAGDPGGTVSISTGDGNDRVLLGDPFATGTAAAPWVGTVDVDLGEGTDQLRAQHVVHGAFTGGGGSDLFRMADTDTPVAGAAPSGLALDLVAGTLAVTTTTPLGLSQATLFDDAYVTGFQVTDLTGDDAVNTLFTTTCGGRLSGGAGDDTLAATKGACTLPKKQRVITFKGGAGADLVAGSRHANRIFGGSGSDDLIGDGGNDLIVGGKGRDKADGGPGRDTCRTEKRKHCELG